MVFDTKISNKNFMHIRCKSCPIKINIKNELIKYFIFLVQQLNILKGAKKKMCWKNRYYNKLLKNAFKKSLLLVHLLIKVKLDLIWLKRLLKFGFERLFVIGLKRLFNVLLEWLFNNHKLLYRLFWWFFEMLFEGSCIIFLLLLFTFSPFRDFI